jgi:fibronectin type 3 domain-containing protein
MDRYRCVLAGFALLLCACGYVGDPLPPALNIPERVTDLRAIQSGDRIVVDFTMPSLTTEGLPIRRPARVELKIGSVEPPFDSDRWAAVSQTVEVEDTAGAVHAETPAREWYGREVVIGVRLVNHNGRASEWSDFVTIPVVQTLATPADVRAAPHAKGVQLKWSAPSRPDVRYRILRRAEDEKERVAIATVSGMEYVDTTATTGKRYEYAVQSVLGSAQSEVSAPATVAAADVFPPAAPAGLTAVASLSSIELGWERNADSDLSHYRVYRGEGEGPLASIADRVEGPAYSDKQISSGMTYRYAVAAVDTAGNEGPQSPPVSAVAP